MCVCVAVCMYMCFMILTINSIDLKNTTQTQTLGSLYVFISYPLGLGPDFIISNLHAILFLSCSSLLEAGWCSVRIDVFPTMGKWKSSYAFIRNVFLWRGKTWNIRHLEPNFAGHQNRALSNRPQAVTVREKPDEWDHAMDRAQNPTNTKIPHASSNVKPGFETAYFVNKSAECPCALYEWPR